MGLIVASFKRPTATQETTQETTQDSTKEAPKKRQRNTKELLLQKLREQPQTSVKALALALNASEASVRHHLRVLQTVGKVRHVGPTKGGYWEVLD